MSAITGNVEDASDVVQHCIELHYDRFDTLGIEESSIPDDVYAAAHSFRRASVPIALLDLESCDVEIDEEKVKELVERIKAGAPPAIVLGRDLQPIDGWHRALAAHAVGHINVTAYIPDLPACINKVTAAGGQVAV
jgi:hypothetical protein